TASSSSSSAAVEVWPSVNRSDERARSSSGSMASSTCEGCATPAEHAEPVEQATPAASRSSSSASPSQPGKEKWALPGSRSTGPPSLCPDRVSAAAPEAAKSTGTCPTACTASVWYGTPYPAATAARAATGWTVPTSLLAHIVVTRATSSAYPSISAASTSGRTR